MGGELTYPKRNFQIETPEFYPSIIYYRQQLKHDICHMEMMTYASTLT